ncbi:MAG: acetyl-CoA carboxylase biotin carboxylase subunit family protein [Paludibacteraceae bacterium]
MKRVLVLNGSFCEIPLIEQCHALGYYVITTGNMSDLIGHDYADEYIAADYSDYEAVLSIVKSHHIDAVLTCANDFGAITAAYIDEHMGWHRRDTFGNAQLLHHKDLFKTYIQQKGYPTPISVVFTEKRKALEYIDTIRSFPVIVKANDLTGGKGILRADDKAQGVIAVENAFQRSRSKHIVIEPYVVGRQQTFVTFLYQKKVIASASCDSFSYVNPYLIQAETLPAKDIDIIRDKLIRIIEEIASDLQLADGIFAFQYIRNGEDLYIIEMMRRPFGNQFLQLVEWNSDFPWHLAQVIVETGGDWGLVQRKQIDRPYCGHFGVMTDRNGKLKGWSIPEDIREHIVNMFVMKHAGDYITDYNNERVAFLHFAYDNYDEMEQAVQTYYQRIKIDLV